MKICSKCKKILPLTSFNKNQYNCKECKKTLFSIYSNTLSRKEEKQKYYQEHKKEILQKQKQFYKDNKDNILEKQKKYNLENHDLVNERTKQWKEANKNYYKEYQKEYSRIYRKKSQ